MQNLYPAGKTINIPVSVDVVWAILSEVMNQLTPDNGGGSVAPPRRRPGAVVSKMLDFVRSNPGRYCTREILQQNPGLNGGSTKWALYHLRKRGLIDRTQDGKWFPKAE